MAAHRRSARLGLALLAATAMLGPTSAGASPAAASPTTLDAAARTHPATFLDRVGWGADAPELAALKHLGASQWLEAQFHQAGPAALPAAIAQQLARLEVNEPLDELVPPLVREVRAIRQARRDGATADASATAAELKAFNQRKNALTQQAMAQQLLLAIYAPDQLEQRLTWFWLNHFNVFRGGNIGPMMADYAERVIAPRALGHFRDLLAATMFSPQMLLYLNNAQNARGHINENYAREVMELHTLGVGSGYTQTDVTNLARVLTGLGVDLVGRPVRVRPIFRGEVWQHGLVLFNPVRHDPDPKVVLGHTLEGSGIDEIQEVTALLADNPATARHVSLELAQYFVADHPAPALVAAMVSTWARTQGDIAAVLNTMFTSPQFAASLSRPQFKDPMRYVISAVRASLDGRLITNPQPLMFMLNRLGEPLYGRQTPDGYPLMSGAWNSPGQLTARFEVARQLGAGAPALFAPPPAWLTAAASPAASAPVPVALRAHEPPPDLARSPVFLACEPELGRATLQALVQADKRVSWNALWLSSPEFMND